MIFSSSAGVGPGPVLGWCSRRRYCGELMVFAGFIDTTNDRVDSGQAAERFPNHKFYLELGAWRLELSRA
jgi:hypothetical protein